MNFPNQSAGINRYSSGGTEPMFSAQIMPHLRRPFFRFPLGSGLIVLEPDDDCTTEYLDCQIDCDEKSGVDKIFCNDGCDAQYRVCKWINS